MRKLSIKRKKSFTGGMIPYFCIVGVKLLDFKVEMKDSTGSIGEFYENLHRIDNGAEVTFDICDEETTCFIYSDTSTGPAYSDEITIEAGHLDIAYLLETKYSFIKGSHFQLTRI